MRWILSFLFAVYAITIYKLVNWVFPKGSIEPKPTLDLPLKEFGSHGPSQLIRNSTAGTKSWSALYEEMCLTNPLQYKGDPRIPEIL